MLRPRAADRKSEAAATNQRRPEAIRKVLLCGLRPGKPKESLYQSCNVISYHRRGVSGGIESAADEVDVIGSEGEGPLRHGEKIPRGPVFFHDAVIGVAVDALNHMRDFVDQNVGEQDIFLDLELRGQIAHAIEKDYDAPLHAGEGIGDGERTRLKVGGRVDF